MKKILFIVAVGITCTLASCKKDRTCTCIYTNSGSSNTDTHVTTFNKVTKKSANSNCTSGTTFDQSNPSDFQTRNCTLSK